MVRTYNLPPDPDAFTPSVDDSLSPSDGYFNDRSPPVPQEVFVEDPSQNATPSKGKEAERDRDAQRAETRSYTPYTPTSSTSNGSMGRRYRYEDEALESSPLLDNIPPPAYEAATVGRAPNTQNNANAPNQDMNRVEIGLNALEIGSPDMFRRAGRRTPENMRGGPPFYDQEEFEGYGPRLWRCCGRYNFSLTRKVIKRVLLMLLILSVTGGILCGVINEHGGFDGNTCSGAHHTKNEIYEFSPKSFTFERSGSDWSKMRTGGRVDVIRGSPNTQTSAIKVELHLQSSEKGILSRDSLITKTPTSLTINSPSLLHAVPQHSQWASRLNPCLAVRATVSILPDTVLSNFNLLLPSFSLKLASDLSLTVKNTTKISSTSSSINFPPSFATHGDKHVFSSRETHIHLTSGSIHGTYPLRDILDLSTTSGSISIDVVPEEADPSFPSTPGAFLASTMSGSVNVNFPRSYSAHSIPQREYISTISTKSGSINGHFLHGSDTSLSTTSGSISISLLPISAKNATSSILSTSTSSGSTSLRLEPPPLGQSLKGLNAKHECIGSGSANIQYPREWEGTATVHVGGSGSVSVGGNGIDVVRKERKYVQGIKGDRDASVVECYGRGSGSFRFQVDY